MNRLRVSRYNRAAMSPEIAIVRTLLALIEVAVLMLLLRGLLWLFGPRMRNHLVYGIFTAGSMPFIRLARRVMPRAVNDRYVPLVAVVLLVTLWIALSLALQPLCARPGVRCT